MSHIPQRKEKDCLNCFAIVQGRFCQQCGQENLVPKENFWHMITHFFSDITHFSSKYFVTVKNILLKPDFLSRAYMQGYRKKYLHPIQMYMFTSAIFFLLFFGIFSGNDGLNISFNDPTGSKEGEKYVTYCSHSFYYLRQSLFNSE